MGANGGVTQEAGASATMILSHLNRDNSVLTPYRLKYQSCFIAMCMQRYDIIHSSKFSRIGNTK